MVDFPALLNSECVRFGGRVWKRTAEVDGDSGGVRPTRFSESAHCAVPQLSLGKGKSFETGVQAV